MEPVEEEIKSEISDLNICSNCSACHDIIKVVYLKTEDNDECFALINLVQCLKCTAILWNFLDLASSGS